MIPHNEVLFRETPFNEHAHKIQRGLVLSLKSIVITRAGYTFALSISWVVKGSQLPISIPYLFYNVNDLLD